MDTMSTPPLPTGAQPTLRFDKTLGVLDVGKYSPELYDFAGPELLCRTGSELRVSHSSIRYSPASLITAPNQALRHTCHANIPVLGPQLL